MSFLLKLIILGIFLINFSFVLFANSNSSIFKHIECEIKFGNNKSKFLSLDIADTFEKRSYGLMNREKMEYDLVIVGAGPSGLSAAIEFRKLCQKNNLNYSVCIVEKGSQVGSHILSGAVLETRALDELIPEWKEKESPIKTEVNDERFLFLKKKFI